MPVNGTPQGSKVVMLVRIECRDVLTPAERESLIDASQSFYADLLQCSRITGRVEIAEIGGDIVIVDQNGGAKV
jgi:hypothetical protein